MWDLFSTLYVNGSNQIIENTGNVAKFIGEIRIVSAINDTVKDAVGLLSESARVVLSPNKENSKSQIQFTEHEDNSFVIISHDNNNNVEESFYI